MYLAQALGPRGEFDAALDAALRALSTAEDIAHSQWITAAHLTLGDIYRNLMAYDTARQHFERAFEVGQTIHSPFVIRLSAGFLASAQVAAGALDDATHLLETITGIDTDMPTLAERMLWTARAELALSSKQPERALEMIDRLITSAPEFTGNEVIPRLWVLRAQALIALHRTKEAEITLQAALRTVEDQAMPPMQWRILASMAHLYMSIGRRDNAEDCTFAAKTVIELLAAKIADETLRYRFIDQSMTALPQFARSRRSRPRRKATMD